jgi:hypothetical protein
MCECGDRQEAVGRRHLCILHIGRSCASLCPRHLCILHIGRSCASLCPRHLCILHIGRTADARSGKEIIIRK